MNNRVETGTGRNTLPLGFWFLLSGSLAERAAFQGIRVVLVLFLIERMGYSEGSASSLVSWFVALCYLFPLAAAWLGDRWLSRSQSLLLFAIVATVGYALLPIESAAVVLFAVILIALGSGGVKPHAPTLIGVTLECHRPGDLQLRSAAFSYLYAGINVAWAVAALGFPVLRAEFGYREAFLVLAATMVLSAAMFAAGRRHYGSEPISDSAACTGDLWSAVKKMGVFAPTIVFWSLLEQSATTWTIFARDHVDLELGSMQLHPDMIQGLNPILVLLLAPFWRWAVVRLSQRGITMHGESQVLLGFAFAFLSALVIALAAALSAPLQLVSVGWMAAAHVFLAAAELGVAAASLEAAFTEGPPRHKAFFGACWLLMPFFGNVLNAAMAPLYDALGSQTYFATLAAIVGLGGLSFFALTAAAGRRRESCSPAVPNLSPRNAVMSETDLYQRQWNPRLYLDKYYSLPRLSCDEQAIFQFLFETFDADKTVHRRAIEFGCGPTVHHALALAPHVAEIHLADYLPENLAEVRAWLEHDPNAHKWDLWLQRILELEGRRDVTHSDIRDRAGELRRKVTALKLGDVRQSHPLGDGSRYDLVASFFCCEAVTPSKPEWRRLMRNLCRLLEPGGTLILAAARRCQAYSVLDSRFPTAFVEESDFLEVLNHSGFDLDRTVVRAVDIASDWSDQGSQSICLVRSKQGVV